MKRCHWCHKTGPRCRAKDNGDRCILRDGHLGSHEAWRLQDSKVKVSTCWWWTKTPPRTRA